MQTEGQHRSQLSTNRPTKEYKCNKCNNDPKRRSPKAKDQSQATIRRLRLTPPSERRSHPTETNHQLAKPVLPTQADEINRG